MAAEILLNSGFADECPRILIEPAEGSGDARTNVSEIEIVLNRVRCPCLQHGLGASAWEFINLAAERIYDTPTGFEDTLQLPDGSLAESKAEMVAAPRTAVAEVVSP